MTSRPISLAFPLIGRDMWTGGFNYLKNTLRVIRSRLDSQVEATVFLSPAEHEKYAAQLTPLVDRALIVHPHLAPQNNASNLAGVLLTGRDRTMEKLFGHHGVDVVFEVGSFHGARFGIPAIAWLPDLQHRFMPEMFTHANWWRRDLGFRAQVRYGRTLMISSMTARRDMERFYPASKDRGHVVRLAIELDIARHMSQAADMRQIYQLPERFFFLPNQFWRHKNHSVIVSALAQLKAEGGLDAMPPIVLSGLNRDPRGPRHFEALMAQSAAAGVDSHFRYLGLIPYDHVLGLVGTCERLINPSFFEGWSTPIEEAKAMGAPMILSDIAIHREQAPGARFFDPASVGAAARVLLEAAASPPAPRAAIADLIANQSVRVDEHGASLLQAVRAAFASRNNRAC